MVIDPKYRNAYSAYVTAVILAVNNNPMRFSDRSGGVSRRRVILPFPETTPPDERDPQLLDKIRLELAVIVRPLMPLATPTGLYIGNANIRPLNPKRYLYHAYLSFMESRGHQYPMSLTAFVKVIPQTLKEYDIELLKQKTRSGIQTSLELSEECEADWLPRYDA